MMFYLLNDSIDLTLRLCTRVDTILRTQQGLNNGPFFLLESGPLPRSVVGKNPNVYSSHNYSCTAVVE